MHINRKIERFIRETPGMTPSRFGREAVNDPALVGDIRKGRDLGRAVKARVERFIDGYVQP